LPQLQELLKKGDQRLLHDIDLLEELSWLLRNGRAEIILKEDDNDDYL